MRRNILTMLVCALALTAFAQESNELLSHIKKIRHTFFFLDDAMTELDVRYDDQYLIRYFYDANGNKILEQKRQYDVNRTTTYISYKYNENNQLIESVDGITRYAYSYNEKGNVSKREKYTSDVLKETVEYEYDEYNVLRKERVYGSSGSLSSTYEYIYGDGRINNRIKYNSSNLKSGNLAYFYDEYDRLIEECDSVIRTGGSSAGKVGSATRRLYSYDDMNRLYEETSQVANVTTAGITGWTNKEKYVYQYEGESEKLIRKEIHIWSTSKEVFEIHEHEEYTMSSQYGNEFMPQNVVYLQNTSITTIPVKFDKPANTTNLKGYQVIADNTLLDTIYTTESFDIENQVKGTHSYRIMAVYDTIAANVTDAQEYTIEVVLPSPSNAVIESQEYSGTAYGWSVSFTFTPPTYPNDLTLTGYRYVVIGGNGGKKGTADAGTQRISFSQLYPDTKNNENNLCTVELYAVYAEGESAPYTFELDLRDTNKQIITKWKNERSERTDANGTILDSKHYYYTSDFTGEVLVSTVDYNRDNLPTLRHSTVDGIQYTDTWNAETMQWEKYKSVETSKEKDALANDWKEFITTKVYDAASASYITTEIVEQYCYYSATYKTIIGNTTTYTVENGEKNMVSYATHYVSDDESLAVDTLYATDKTTKLGLIESRYYTVFNSYGSLESKTLTSKTTYKYENGEFIATELLEQERNPQTGLTTVTTLSGIDAAGNKNLIETTTYYASKEYGSIKVPTKVAYANGLLTWNAPSNKNMVPTSYRIFINNILYGEVSGETSMEIDNIPSGKYTFTVMALYDGSESNYSASVEVVYTNLSTLNPVSVTPDVYDIEKDNHVSDLSKVTLTFASAIESILGDATLNSRAGYVGNPEAQISEDGMSVIFTMPANLGNGMYFFDIPEGMIVAADGTYNPALNYMFVLQLPLTYDLPKPTADPADGKSFDTTVGLEVITLTFDRNVYTLETTVGATGIVYAENTDNNSRIEATIDIENNDYTKWVITLAEKVSKEGSYRIVVPAATFGDETASASAYTGSFTSGKVNAEFTLNYVVAASVEDIENDVVIRVENRNIIAPAEAKVYNLQGIETGKENVAAGIYIVEYQGNVTKLHVR